MRIFASILGGLFLLLGVATGGFGGLVLAGADSDGTITCNTTASTSGSSTTYCSGDGSGDSQYQAVGLAFVIGGAGFFIGGCALVGGAVASSRKPAAVVHQPQSAPVASSGPPSYGGGPGWQGSAPTGGS